MNATRKLWISLAGLLLASFGVLLWLGGEIHRVMPPIPDKVATAEGRTLYTRADIETGRQVWQSVGGHQLGSIWGHGSYVAPDWSADALHREAVAWLDVIAQREHGRAFKDLGVEQRAALQARFKPLIRANTFDAAANTITVSEERAAAIAQVASHYQSLFGNDPATQALRKTPAQPCS